MSTTIEPTEPEVATGQAVELLRQTKVALGLVPNMAKVMAASPALLRSYLALAGAVGSGTLPTATREQLAIATAQLNGCEYCLSPHTYSGAKAAKASAAELEAARRAESGDTMTNYFNVLADVQNDWPAVRL